MMIQTNTTDRKALVKAIAEELHTDYRYLRTPTYAYEVGDYTVDRGGNIIGDDFAPLRDFLLRNGFITEDAWRNIQAPAEEPETAAEVEDAEAPVESASVEIEETAEAQEAEPAEVEDPEAPVESTSAGIEETAETQEAKPAEPEPDSEEEQQPAESAGQDIDTQTITIPAPGITVEQLRNLTYTLYSRQYILNLMTGGRSAPCGDTIQIPDALVVSLKNTLPETPERFSEFLEIYRGFGLKGFDFKDGQFSLTFPFYETEPTKWTTFAGLQGRILQAALAAKRVFPELLKPDEEAEKYTAHIWLQRMGYKGPEMKEQRNILLHHLHGYCAFSNGAKMQRHKDKYSAIRRERREAERAAAAEAITAPAAEPTAPTTTEAKALVVADTKEVPTNE